VVSTGLEVLLRFLLDFGLPWLGFRQSIREGDAKAIDIMYVAALSWFRAAGKFQYASICIDTTWTKIAVHPDIRHVWDNCRTISLLGYAGHNIACDQGAEFMNLDLKAGNPHSPDRIDAYICMMNGMTRVDENIRAALGAQRSEPSDYSPVKRHHVDAVVTALKNSLGATEEDLFGENRKKASPFGGGPRPWLRTQNPGNLPPGASAADRRAEVVAFVSSQLENNPFPSWRALKLRNFFLYLFKSVV